MAADVTCPSPDDLTSLLRGTLPPHREEAVNEHIDVCATCRLRADEIEQTTDPVMAALRRTDTPAVSADTGKSEMAAAPRAAEPFSIPGYRVIGEIGRGGMGVVYQAVQHKLNRLVAVKMILSGRLAGAEERVRFLLEGGLLARLSHPNFVQVFEVGTVDLSEGGPTVSGAGVCGWGQPAGPTRRPAGAAA